MNFEGPWTSREVSMRRLLESVMDVVEPFLAEAELSRSDSEFARRLETSGHRTIDATLWLRGANGLVVNFLAQIVDVADPKEREIDPRLRRLEDQAKSSGNRPLLIAPYLSPPVRDRLRSRRVSYADATGNLWLFSDSPALAVRNNGADRNPYRRPGRERSTLRGDIAARVVRALVDSRPPVSVPELIERSGASPSAAYRVVELLRGENLIEKKGRDPITFIEWKGILRRWVSDYGDERQARGRAYFGPRGADDAVQRLRGSEAEYVLSGSFAANRYTDVTAPALAVIYTANANALADEIGVVPELTRPNVLLYEDGFSWALQGVEIVDGFSTAAPSQVAIDLLTGPGREPSEGESFMEWMERNYAQWR